MRLGVGISQYTQSRGGTVPAPGVSESRYAVWALRPGRSSRGPGDCVEIRDADSNFWSGAIRKPSVLYHSVL